MTFQSLASNVLAYQSRFAKSTDDRVTSRRIYEAGERSARIIAKNNQRFALQTLDICWFTMPRDRARGAPLTKQQNGHSKTFAAISFRSTRLREDVVHESFGLYKLGLRLNRLFIFLALGFSNAIPFATHDWSLLGDHRDGEEAEHRGLKMRASFSTAPAERGPSIPASK
jgi:hypothetical protein